VTDQASEQAADQLPDLLEILVAEFRDGGIDVTLVPESLGAPAQLVVSIDDAESGGPSTDNHPHLRINTYFVPDIDNPPVLQYFVTLPYTVDPTRVDELARLLCMINTNLPLTGFELSEHNEVMVFRHTHAISVRPLDPGVIAWTWAMIRSAVIEFGPLLDRADLSVDDAATSLDELMQALLND
jgi:hypothetical protein